VQFWVPILKDLGNKERNMKMGQNLDILLKEIFKHENGLKFRPSLNRNLLNAEYIKENLECRLFENSTTNS